MNNMLANNSESFKNSYKTIAGCLLSNVAWLSLNHPTRQDKNERVLVI